MASFIDNIIFGRQYTAIEFFSLGSEDRIAFLQVKRKKSEIFISQGKLFQMVGDLSNEKTKSPAVLVINNSQVLFKEIQGNDTNDRKLLHKAFPNLQPEEFYYEIWRKGAVSVISICRKSYLDDLTKSLEKDFRIVSVSLGVSAMANLIAVSNVPVVTTNTQIVQLASEESIIAASVNNENTYSINGLEISNNYILGFASILEQLLGITTTGNIAALNAVLKEAYRQKSFFEKIFKSGLVTVLSILLINFLLFSYYFDKAAALNETITLNKAGIENITKIKERIKNKEKRLETFTTDENSRTAVLINEIVKKIPFSISLTEVDYQPLEKKIKPEEKIIVMDKGLIIKGVVLNNEAFTKWIEETGKIKNIEKVVITNFGKDQDNNTVFSLKITML